jgi:hypothetical protein
MDFCIGVDANDVLEPQRDVLNGLNEDSSGWSSGRGMSHEGEDVEGLRSKRDEERM